MNTHIIIPIKDIEEKIVEFRYECNNEQDRCRSSWASGKADILEELLEENKQISLDEKDINWGVVINKTVELWHPISALELSGIRRGYIQAYKDIFGNVE